MTAARCTCFPSWSLSLSPRQTTAVGPVGIAEGGGQAEDDTLVLAGFKGWLWLGSSNCSEKRWGKTSPKLFSQKGSDTAALATRALLDGWF